MSNYLDEILGFEAEAFRHHPDCRCPGCCTSQYPSSNRTVLDEILSGLSSAGIKSAMAYNRRSSQNLGWAAHRSGIASRLLNLGQTPDETSFAQAVAGWQGAKGLKADGQLGPRTWSMMKAALGLSGAPASPGNVVAAGRETTPPLQTIYTRIDLRIPQAKPLTGIYVPPNFRQESPLEIIVYLHGWTGYAINSYWKQSKFPLREALAQSGRNCILVAPTLGPKAQAGTLPQPGGFDRFMSQVVAVLKSESVISSEASVSRIILACHSGGGSPMRRIARLNDSYAQLIRECWGFDCLYSKNQDVDLKEWRDWAMNRSQAKLFIYYYNTTTDQSVKLACKAPRLPNVFVQEAKVKDHNLLVLPSWQERLVNMPAGPFNYARC